MGDRTEYFREYRNRNRERINAYTREYMREWRQRNNVDYRLRRKIREADEGEIITGGYQPYGEIIPRCKIK